MTLLTLDTSANLCSVALSQCDDASMVAAVSDDIGRGHAEVLMQQVESCISQAGISYQDIQKVAVTIGPGSFTGVRVGMAAARGLALGLAIPLTGISTLDAALAHAREFGAEGKIAVMLDAKRDQAYCKLPDQEPVLLGYEKLIERLKTFDGSLCGSGAVEFVSRGGKKLPIVHEASATPISTIARFAMSIPVSDTAPEPLYLRSADAKKQTGFALPRVEA